MAFQPGLLDTGLPTRVLSQTKPDIGGAVNIFTSLQANKRANQSAADQHRLSELTLDQEERKILRKKKFNTIMQSSLNENGQVDSQKAITGLNQAGMFEEANLLRERRVKSQEQSMKMNAARDQILGQSASAILESENPVGAFSTAITSLVKQGVPVSPGLKGYVPTEEEILDGRFSDPRIENELEYLRDKSLTPEQRLARKKAKDTVDQPEEYGLKPIYGKKGKDIVAFQASKGGKLKQIDIPEGVTLTPGLQYQNIGNKIVGLDKSGTPVISLDKGVPTEQTAWYKALVAGAVQEAKGIEKPSDVKERSKKAITRTVNQMRDLYIELNELGGIVNIEKGSLKNLGARISSSKLGQAAQKALGTKTQSLRNSVKAMQPELLGAIRKASDMGAKGMDSERELEFYLRAATDPSEDLQFNLRALQKLDEAYGLGLNLVQEEEEVDPETELLDGIDEL